MDDCRILRANEKSYTPKCIIKLSGDRKMIFSDLSQIKDKQHIFINFFTVKDDEKYAVPYIVDQVEFITIPKRILIIEIED